MKRIPLKQKIVLILFGLFLCAALLEIGLRIGGFVILSLQEYRNQLSIKQKGEYRILCLGESTTADGGKYSYPRQLEEALNKRNLGVEFSVINKGIHGIDTGTILSQLEYNLKKYSPHMITIMMGINDREDTIAHVENISLKMKRNDNRTDVINVDDISSKDKLSFSSFRIYKLLHWLQFRITWKLEEIQILYLRPKEEGIAFFARESVIRANRLYKRISDPYVFGHDISKDYGWTYLRLGRRYMYAPDDYNFSKARKMLEKAIENNPKNYEAYFELGRHYRWDGDNNRAMEMLERSLQINPENDWPYIELAHCYRSEGFYDKAEEMLENARKLRFKYVNSTTAHNYQNLRDIILGRGIKLVCVQYPLRNIEVLKKTLKGYEGIVFVDNEMLFKKALEQEDYEEYFKDVFAGDFGHCTRKGNRLLAENIANTILKECFDIKIAVPK